MAKRVTHKKEEPPVPPKPDIFIRLIKVNAEELVTIEFEEGDLSRSIKMEKPDKQRPVEEFYENFRELNYHVVKIAELPANHADYVRTTGLRIKYEGSSRQRSAALIGWRELRQTQGGYVIPLPYKKIGSAETSQTDGDAHVVTNADGTEEHIAKDGSSTVTHSNACAEIIRRQLELAIGYIEGQRAQVTLFDPADKPSHASEKLSPAQTGDPDPSEETTENEPAGEEE